MGVCPEGVHPGGGCMPGREGCMPGGVCLGVSAGDVSAQGGDCLPRGVCLPGGGGVSA